MHFSFPTRVTCPDHLPIVYSFTIIMFDEEESTTSEAGDYAFFSIPWSFHYHRGAQAVHTAQCAMMCAVVPCTRARDGTARHVAGKGRAASAIGGEGERTLSERQMICLLRYGGGAGSTIQFAHLHRALHACRNLVHLCTIMSKYALSALFQNSVYVILLGQWFSNCVPRILWKYLLLGYDAV
jgi:hypothetical protein